MEERHYLVGTAGHVDHGKTELIRALTGIETDRLKEEKQRGISIELGFAHLTLPSGRSVGIVDVPGHERFVRQMLAGASGMDIVLLVIAADEGVMPQTREHLDILTLLGVARGIVVINKLDLVDGEWLDLVAEEIREELKNTVFANAPLCPVSALTRAGMPELLATMDRMLDEAEAKTAQGPVRMPLDRVFTIQGFGTVVTGTLHSGTVAVGQELVIEPIHLPVKVRSLQVHGEKVARASAGQRVAVNLAGVGVSGVEKGAVLATPQAFLAGNILDLKIRNLASNDKPLVHRQRVRFHLGTAEILGRLHLLEAEELPSGQEGYGQIILEKPVLAAAGDRFVIRFYSPPHTIAGGKVLGVGEFKAKRFKENVVALLKLKDRGDPHELLLKECYEPRTCPELRASLHLPENELLGFLTDLHRGGRLEIWPDDSTELYWAVEAAAAWRAQLVAIVRGYEGQFPLRNGLGREELKARLGVAWPHRRWQNILEEGAARGYYRLSGGKIKSLDPPAWPADLQSKIACLRQHWQQAGLTPPDLLTGVEECKIVRSEAPEYAQYLVETGEWQLIGGIYFATEAVLGARRELLALLDRCGEASVADIRELWRTSRKYAVPLLEHFDQLRVTRRQGDKRVRYT